MHSDARYIVDNLDFTQKIRIDIAHAHIEISTQHQVFAKNIWKIFMKYIFKLIIQFQLEVIIKT